MKILFVCTGNTCRSPMAAALLRRALDKRGRQDIMVESAGLSAFGEPAASNAIAAVAEHDPAAAESMGSHRSRTVTAEQLANADWVFVMSAHHREAVLSLGAHPERVAVLSENGIPDPYGGDMKRYRHTYNQLARAVEEIADRLTSPSANR